jgi:hypothetical protein
MWWSFGIFSPVLVNCITKNLATLEYCQLLPQKIKTLHPLSTPTKKGATWVTKGLSEKVTKHM